MINFTVVKPFFPLIWQPEPRKKNVAAEGMTQTVFYFRAEGSSRRGAGPDPDLSDGDGRLPVHRPERRAALHQQEDHPNGRV